MLGVSIGKSNYRATACFPNVDAERVVLRCPAQGFPRKFWKKIKIKQAIDRARRERLRGCHPGDFAFTFANDPCNEGNYNKCLNYHFSLIIFYFENFLGNNK